jgi:carboxypeptidase C (cathepsin A)
MATPFFGAEYDFHHLSLEPDRQANLTFRYYPSGHMTYIEPTSAHQLHADFESFYSSAR